jgi:flagellar biosynthesis repressor protein FlbT
MPLKLTLKPNEKVLIGNAVIVNGDSKSEIILLNQVPLLRERDIISEEQADSISKKIYLTILNMYAEPQKEQTFHPIYFDLIRIMLDTYLDKDLLLKIADLSALFGAEEMQEADQIRTGGAWPCRLMLAVSPPTRRHRRNR